MAVSLLRKPPSRRGHGAHRPVLVAAIVLVAGLSSMVFGTTPAMASKKASSSWSIRQKYPEGLTVLVAVSCPTTSLCWAVGKNAAGYGAMLDTTDGGSTWTPDQLPRAVGSLNAISCVDATHCWAVGFTYVHGPLVIRTIDGGRRWTSEKAPGGTTGDLTGVSCVSTTQCWAVGGTFVNNVAGGLVIVTTDGGRRWLAQPVPTGIGDPTAISCVNASLCWAVDYNAKNGIISTDDGGKTWVLHSSLGILTDISCPSTSDCFAVGYTSNGNVVMEATTDGGNTWAPQALPSQVPTSYTNISCSSISDCWAGGFNNDGPAMLATTDGGSTWTLQSLPSLVAQVVAISCVGPSNCVALSDAATVVALDTTDGGATWAAATLRAATPYIFNGISCPSPSQCWAVGADTDTNSGVVVATSDGGKTWTTENLPSGVPVLQGISCPSTSECFAVGYVYAAAGFVVSTTDAGGTWTAPNYFTGEMLRGISCPSTSDCWVAGDSSVYGIEANKTYATVDGGTTWTSQTFPVPFDDSGAISCASISDCVTTGGDNTAMTTDGGATWALQLLPQNSLPFLRAISCASSDCSAVGTYPGGPIGGAASTSTEGNFWNSGHLPAGTLGLNAISCPTPSECWAMGGDPYVSNVGVALTTGNGGSSWSRHRLPKGVANISAVSCPTTSTCLAVGITSSDAVVLSLSR